MRRLLTSRLIRIYTLFVILFSILDWNPFFASVGMSKFKDWRALLMNSWMKGLMLV